MISKKVFLNLAGIFMVNPIDGSRDAQYPSESNTYIRSQIEKVLTHLTQKHWIWTEPKPRGWAPVSDPILEIWGRWRELNRGSFRFSPNSMLLRKVSLNARQDKLETAKNKTDWQRMATWMLEDDPNTKGIVKNNQTLDFFRNSSVTKV